MSVQTAKRSYNWSKPVVPPHKRILTRLGEQDPEGCWLWPGSISPQGYGMIRVGSRQDGTRTLRVVHVVLYEFLVGPVPDGLEIDHLCRVRACCNPLHLEPVTHQENMKRMPETYKEILRQRIAAARELRWVTL